MSEVPGNLTAFDLTSYEKYQLYGKKKGRLIVPLESPAKKIGMDFTSNVAITF